MSKYKLEKKSKDNYTLTYKDKSFDFKTDVALISKMQGVYKKARKKMILDLASSGKTISDLSVEYKKDGKSYVDNSNKTEYENIFIEDEMTVFIDEVSQDIFKMPFTELIVDMELGEDEIEKFTTEFISALTGQIPLGR